MEFLTEIKLQVTIKVQQHFCNCFYAILLSISEQVVVINSLAYALKTYFD